MTWNYRIVKRRPGHYELCEVYYDAEGRPESVTVDPVSFSCDADEGAAGIIDSLEKALKDATEPPVLDEAATWPKPEEP